MNAKALIGGVLALGIALAGCATPDESVDGPMNDTANDTNATDDGMAPNVPDPMAGADVGGGAGADAGAGAGPGGLYG